MIAPNLPSLEEIRREFVELLPGLASRLSARFCYVNPEARSDAVAEAVGLAWQTYVSARMKNKQVGIGTLAFYSGKSVTAGRKVAGATSMDAMSDTAIARQRIGTHVTLEEKTSGQNNFYHVFGDKRWRWPVLDYVATSMDMDAFKARCSRRDRQVMRMMAAGHPQTEIARQMKISPPAVSQRLRSLHSRWQAMTAA